jgi:hypothetical protein
VKGKKPSVVLRARDAREGRKKLFERRFFFVSENRFVARARELVTTRF